MTVIPDPSVFDFSKVDMPPREDLIVRATDESTGRWVEVLITPSGRRAIWDFSGWDFEEAVAWARQHA